MDGRKRIKEEKQKRDGCKRIKEEKQQRKRKKGEVNEGDVAHMASIDEVLDDSA